MRNKLTQGEFMDSAHVGRMNFVDSLAHDIVYGTAISQVGLEIQMHGIGCGNVHDVMEKGHV